LTLDLELLVTPRGSKASERGFELGLPRAAITTIDFLDVPETLRELRCNGRSLTAKDLSSGNGQRKPVPLGAADRLDLSWKGPAPQQVQPQQTAQGTLDVRIDESQVTTDGDLILQMKSGQTALWQIQAPAAPATLEVDVPAGDPRAPAVTAPPADAKVPVWTIKLSGPSDEPLKVHIRARQPRNGKNVAVVPFAVLQAVHQHGTVIVSGPPELRFRARPRPEVSQREVPEELRKAASNIAVFTYWNLPPSKADQMPPAVVDLEVETIKGAVETETSYQLRWTDQGWRVTATFDVTPVRTGLERFEVDLPAEYDLKAGPVLLVEPDPDVKPAGARRSGTFKLTEKLSRPFKLTLEGVCPLPKGAPATVPLPRPLQSLDKGGRVSIALPENMELLSVRESGAGPLTWDKRERTWHMEKSPQRLDLSWQERRAELEVNSQVYVTLTDQEARIEQHMNFPAGVDELKQVVLRGPDLPDDRPPLLGKQPLEKDKRGPHSWIIPLKQPKLVLHYSVALPQPARNQALAVPLLWAEGTTRGRTVVWVWSDPGIFPVLDSKSWGSATEEDRAGTPRRGSYPSLVLRSTSPGVPLKLHLADRETVLEGDHEGGLKAELLSLPAHHVKKALVQVEIKEDGQQNYRARFLLSRIDSHFLDVELPAPPADLHMEILLDGERVLNGRGWTEARGEAGGSPIARLRVEPGTDRKARVLDITYQLSRGRSEGIHRLQTTLYPLRLRDTVFDPNGVRWLIAAPHGSVALCPAGPVVQGWGLRDYLPAPRPALSAADLERWFHDGADSDADEAGLSPSLVCEPSALGPLVVWHVPQQTWLLGCSLVFLALGLTVFYFALPRAIVAFLVLLAGGALVATDFLWPSVLPMIVYGCEPGVVVLLVVVGVQWVLHRRYRRQVIFMPGFSRLKSGSSIVRNGGSSRLRGDPSTVEGQQVAPK
jgi:hypothetical protein